MGGFEDMTPGERIDHTIQACRVAGATEDRVPELAGEVVAIFDAINAIATGGTWRGMHDPREIARAAKGLF